MGSGARLSVRPFGMKDKVGYMFGDFGNDFTFILSSSFMLKFYTDVMGISAGLVGGLMMAARFIDAFTDVTMGQIVDRSKPTEEGKFRPWVKRMSGPVAIASFLIYQSGFVNMAYGFKVFWMVATSTSHMAPWPLRFRQTRKTGRSCPPGGQLGLRWQGL